MRAESTLRHTPVAPAPTVTKGRVQLDVIVGLGFLATGVLIGAIPRFLRNEFGASRSLTGVAATGYFVCALLVRPIIGPRLDRYGRRPFLVWSLLALALTSVAFFAIHAVWAVFALRFLQGAFGAGFYTAALTSTTDIAPPDARASAVGRLSVMVYLGFIFGPMLVDVLLDVSSFNACWAAVIGLYGAAMLLAYSFPETRPSSVADTGSRPTTSRLTMTRLVLWPGVASYAVAVTFGAVSTFSPDYADRVGIARPGTLVGAYAIAVLVSRVVSSRLTDRHGSLVVLLPSCLLAFAGLCVLTFAEHPMASYLGMGLAGLGAGAAFPALSLLVVNLGSTAERGAILAAFLMFSDIGQASAGPMVGWLSDAVSARMVFGTPAILMAGSFLVLLTMRRQQTQMSLVAASLTQ
jgi:MFS family permease